MAIALVSNTSAASVAGANITTAGIDTTGATLLFVHIAFLSSGGRTMSVSDSKGNTWTALTHRAGSGGALTLQVYYVANPTVGTGHTFTATNGGANAFPGITAQAFSGVIATSPFDLENGADISAASTFQPGSVTPSEGNELVITGIQQNVAASFPFTIDGSYNLLGQVTADGGDCIGVATAYIVQTTALATNPTWTPASGSGLDASLSIATFKSSGGGGGGAVAAPMNNLALMGVG